MEFFKVFQEIIGISVVPRVENDPSQERRGSSSWADQLPTPDWALNASTLSVQEAETKSTELFVWTLVTSRGAQKAFQERPESSMWSTMPAITS